MRVEITHAEVEKKNEWTMEIALVFRSRGDIAVLSMCSPAELLFGRPNDCVGEPTIFSFFFLVPFWVEVEIL